MATGSMDEMKYANLYVKKHKPKWKSYFHKLIVFFIFNLLFFL